MTPHFFSLPQELRLRILDYAVVGPNEVFVCKGKMDSHHHEFESIAIPEVRLHIKLACKQLSIEMNSVKVPKLEVRTCDAGCAAA